MDHYITQQLAKSGVPLEYIKEPNISPREKWQVVAEGMDRMIGHQSHLWTHLILKRVLGIDEVLDGANAEAIFDAAQSKLDTDAYRPQELLRAMNVKVVATTDDPMDDLEFHKKAQEMHDAGDLDVSIIPTFRPDRAMNIEAEGWRDYVGRLCASTEQNVSLQGMIDALADASWRFDEMGCTASDHGLTYAHGRKIPFAKANEVFNLAMDGECLFPEDIDTFKSYFMHEMARIDKDAGRLMQIHIGARRNVNNHYMATRGPDSGGDLPDHNIEIVDGLRDLLNEYCTGKGDSTLNLAVYTMHPSIAPTAAMLSRAFATVWWTNPWWNEDNEVSMERELERNIATSGHAYGVGMVCDARTLLALVRDGK